MLAKVWFLLGATIGFSVDICLSRLSASKDGQCLEMICLAALHNAPYLIGKAIGALLTLGAWDCS